ncbi:MAG: HAMP domain-containing histidine kinase, partial [Pseudomonadota bacterium]|nr:HAMP domain-containing histidine kinase [Pseudomonadota bacterium]
SSMMILSLPVNETGRHYLIEMGALTDDLEVALHGLIMTLFFGLPMVALITSAGGYILVRRALKPVESIRATAEQIAFGNLSNRLPVACTGDALEHLSVTLNQMLERLEAAYEQASRFSADASHELRTPLTIMRSELEAMAREKNMPASLRERIGSVLEETERLSRIAENLFAISRLDTGEAKVQHIRVDLATLAQSTAEQMALLAEEKQISLHINTLIPVFVYGDSARLKQIVVNLLDNAIKYTPGHGMILLNVKAASHKAVLEVADNGIGIPADALPHVFNRFYRADKARTREMGGAGLGLSIVRSICQAHGGIVDIESREGEGTACRIELPLANGEEQKG